MYLVADKPFATASELDRPCFEPWAAFPVSYLSDHGTDCCQIARQWLRAMDFAQLNGSDLLSGPRWIRERFSWGPSPWPLHWCEALDAKSVDCGVHAALAQEAFEARGVSALRAQIVQRYDANAVAQWRARWGADGVSDHWLSGQYIYHEANAIVTGGSNIKLWDGSAASWSNPSQVTGYGSVAAIRIVLGEGEGKGAPSELNWGRHIITAGSWVELTPIRIAQAIE